MSGGVLQISSDTIDFAFIILVYILVALVVYRWLAPKLPSPARWLASALLAAQLIVIMASLANPPTASGNWWLWDLNREFNYASTLASTQLALVAGVALLTAALARAQAAPLRLYLVALGLIFVFLAWDEYYSVHEQLENWKRTYAALGGLISLATIAVALRSPGRIRKWHACFLVGLAMSGTAATAFELLPTTCGDLLIFRLRGCLSFGLWEETVEYAGAWLILVAALGLLSDTTAGRRRLSQAIVWSLPAMWVLMLLVHAALPRLELQHLARPVSVQFEQGAQLRGLRLHTDEGAIRLTLFTSAKRGVHAGLVYSLSLVDQESEEVIATQNAPALPRYNFWMLRPGAAPIFRGQIEVALPDQAPLNRTYWIALSIMRQGEEGLLHQKILSSDQRLLGDARVALGEYAPAAEAASLSADPLSGFEGRFVLRSAEIPAGI